MAHCPYCGRWFKNKQAVRAHLKRCPLKSLYSENGKMEKLFIKFLKVLVKSPKHRFKREELARLLGVTIEQIDKLNEWVNENGLSLVLKLLAAGKVALLKSH